MYCPSISRATAISLVIAANCTQADAAKFSIGDYFRVQRVVELAISDDGSNVLYVTETMDLAQNKPVRRLFVQTSRESAARQIDIAGSMFSWIPGSDRIAFIGTVNRKKQVVSYDLGTTQSITLTAEKDPITSYSFSLKGMLAYTAISAPDAETTRSSYDALQTGSAGVRMSFSDVGLYNFLDPSSRSPALNPIIHLVVKSPSGGVFRPIVEGSVQEFHWSPRGDRLSAVVLPIKGEDRLEITKPTRVAVTTPDFGRLEFIDGVAANAEGNAPAYFGGEWVPGTNQVLLRQASLDHAWYSRCRIRMQRVDVSNLSRPVVRQQWENVSGCDYATRIGSRPEFIPINEQQILVEHVVAGVGVLENVGNINRSISEIPVRDSGIMKVRFARDFKSAVFIREALDKPPEVYRWRTHRHGASQLSSLNSGISLPPRRSISWRSHDGVRVTGWLIEPPGPTRRPWPMVIYVHGGPMSPVSDSFAPFWMGGGWGQPLEAYAANGIAVFIPNYRGSASFGEHFAMPRSLDQEPVDDIISGVNSLIEKGYADSRALGITGYSHGAWLGPLVMTKHPIFAAGAFAENVLNQTTQYEMMSLQLNRQVHDVLMRGDPYLNPDDYRRLSPIYELRNVGGALLFESGYWGVAIPTLSAWKTADRAHLPSEFYVYPRTAHDMTEPRLYFDSAVRNVDWFRFWLQRHQDPDPVKASQYERWISLRERFCRGEGNIREFCRDSTAPR